jgi:hypothetical protein
MISTPSCQQAPLNIGNKSLFVPCAKLYCQNVNFRLTATSSTMMQIRLPPPHPRRQRPTNVINTKFFCWCFQTKCLPFDRTHYYGFLVWYEGLIYKTVTGSLDYRVTRGVPRSVNHASDRAVSCATSVKAPSRNLSSPGAASQHIRCVYFRDNSTTAGGDIRLFWCNVVYFRNTDIMQSSRIRNKDVSNQRIKSVPWRSASRRTFIQRQHRQAHSNTGIAVPNPSATHWLVNTVFWNNPRHKQRWKLTDHLVIAAYCCNMWTKRAVHRPGLSSHWLRWIPAATERCYQ